MRAHSLVTMLATMALATHPTVPAGPHIQRASWSTRVFSLPVVLGVLLSWLMLFVSAGGPVVRSLVDPDVWWHLRNARVLVTSGHFIRADAYTYSVGGKPWMNFEWLGELPYYFAYRGLGDRGLYLVLFLVAGSILAGIYCLGRLRSGSWPASFFATAIALLLMTVSLLPRPLLFGWLFLVIEVALLWSFQRGRDGTLLLPPLFLLWINTHGSWFIGFVLMLLFVACGFLQGEWGNLYAVRWTPRQRTRLLTIAAASFAALFLNPYGWRLVVYPLDVAFRQQLTISHIAEWGSTDFHSPRGKLVVGVLVLLAVLQLVRRRRWPLHDVAFAAVALYGAVAYVRFLFLLAVLVMPLVAIDLRSEPDAAPSPARHHRFVSGLAMIALVVLIARCYPGEKPLQAGLAEYFPEKSVSWVRATAGHGNLLANFNWAGYLEWEAPEVKQLIDSRVDIFVHEGVMDDYLRATQPVDTFAILDRYRIRTVLMPRDSPISYLLRHSAGWKVTYDDGQAVGFERAP
jgi:hypothetical protein